MVRKGYIVGLGTVQRCIVDEKGLVFYSGCGGWFRPSSYIFKTYLFPDLLDMAWNSAGWWESNWKHPAWGWLHTNPRTPDRRRSILLRAFVHRLYSTVCHKNLHKIKRSEK